jgi:APA family basic amino acid/polyamine antiporter
MSQKLERSLSLGGAIGLIVGFVIGGSIFVLIPRLVALTGPSLYLAYALSAIPAIFAALYLIQLGGAFPVTGANYIAISRWVSPLAGFSASVLVVIGLISANCVAAWGFAEYLSAYFPQIPSMVYAIAVIIFFSFINWIGNNSFEKVQMLLTAAFILAMLIFGFGGVINMQPELHADLFPMGMDGFFTVVAIASFSWGGVIAVAEVAGEVKNPKRNIPLSIVISMLIIAGLYLLQTYALTSNLLWSEVAEIGPTAVLVAAGKFLPVWVVNFIAIGALLAIATSVNALIMMGSREIYAWSKDQIVPSVFQRINPKYKTPEATILIIMVFSVIGVLFEADLERYAIIVVFALMAVQILGSTAVFLMPKKAPEIYEKAQIRFSPFWRWFTWIGCMILFVGIFIYSFLADTRSGILFISIWILSIVYWFIRKAALKKRGISLVEGLKKYNEAELSDL